MLLTATCGASCAPTGPGQDNGCSWVRPIYLNDYDMISAGTGRDILANNEAWLRICRGGVK